MGDIHVLAGNHGNVWRIAMHFPVPDISNAAGVNVRQALVNSGIGLDVETGRRTVMPVGTEPGQINPAEEALLDAGELFELVAGHRLESGGTSIPQLRASLQGFYASQNARVQANMNSRLRYFGHVEDAV